MSWRCKSRHGMSRQTPKSLEKLLNFVITYSKLIFWYINILVISISNSPRAQEMSIIWILSQIKWLIEVNNKLCFIFCFSLNIVVIKCCCMLRVKEGVVTWCHETRKSTRRMKFVSQREMLRHEISGYGLEEYSWGRWELWFGLHFKFAENVSPVGSTAVERRDITSRDIKCSRHNTWS